MSLIGKGQQFLITTAVAIGNEPVGMAVGQKVEETIHLLLTVAVLRQESASKSAIDHLYLRTDDLDIWKEGLHPIVDRSTHDDDLGLFGTGLLDGLQSQGAQQMTQTSLPISSSGQ